MEGGRKESWGVEAYASLISEDEGVVVVRMLARGVCSKTAQKGAAAVKLV